MCLQNSRGGSSRPRLAAVFYRIQGEVCGIAASCQSTVEYSATIKS